MKFIFLISAACFLLLIGCMLEKKADNAAEDKVYIVNDSSDLSQKRILLIKWLDIIFDWNSKCRESYCYEDNIPTESFTSWGKLHPGAKHSTIIWQDTVEFWGNYHIEIFSIDSVFGSEEGDYIDYHADVEHNKIECRCHILYATKNGDTFGYTGYSGYRFKKESTELYPYELNGGGFSFPVDESYFYDTLTLEREQQFIEFLKTQPDSIKQEYEWVIRHRGYGYLFDNK